jgi:beta-galactosidase
LKATAPDTKAILSYGPYNGWLDGQPAALTRAVGKGRITYIGALLDDRIMDAAAKWMAQDAGVTAALGPVPDGVEVCRRVGPRGNVYVLINAGREPRRVTLSRPMKDVLAGGSAKEVSLGAYGVSVLSDF